MGDTLISEVVSRSPASRHRNSRRQGLSLGVAIFLCLDFGSMLAVTYAVKHRANILSMFCLLGECFLLRSTYHRPTASPIQQRSCFNNSPRMHIVYSQVNIAISSHTPPGPPEVITHGSLRTTGRDP